MTATSIPTLVANAARFLPAQGPITVFVHHNPLHVFEHQPFDDAVREAASLYGSEPYLSEERYRSELDRGRIRHADLAEILRADLGDSADEVVGGLVSRLEFRNAMLIEPIRIASEFELRWAVSGSDRARHFRERCPNFLREQLIGDTRQWVMRELRNEIGPETPLRRIFADLLRDRRSSRIENWGRAAWEEVTLGLLWRLCRAGVRGLGRAESASGPTPRIRDTLFAAFEQDPDDLVHDVLIRFCAAFADQGLAPWSLPKREEGFFAAFLALHGEEGGARPAWLRGLAGQIERLRHQGLTAEESIEGSLVALGIARDQRQKFVTKSLLALRGWAGMLWQLETRPDRVRLAVPPGTLLEFLAIRLLLDRLAASYVARRHVGAFRSLPDVQRSLAEAAQPAAPAPTQNGYLLFRLAQTFGWSPRTLAALEPEDWQSLVREIEDFSEIERRRLLHDAYEKRLRLQFFDALGAHEPPPAIAGSRPSAQLICCLDEREESLRRHFEEIDPAAETYGTAGFFGVAMYYEGAWDAHEIPLCPVAIRPEHRVRESAVESDSGDHVRGTARVRRLGMAQRSLRLGSRGFMSGLFATLLGSIAAVPLVARVLFPRLSSRLRQRARRWLRSDVRTRLLLERSPEAALARDGVHEGYAPHEMAAIVERTLTELGLKTPLSRLVVVLGHGSSSLNNPHEAAHDCGACGGGRGGPNARAFALMANRCDVRSLLAAAGWPIPEDTIFVGAYHNTCDDDIETYDADDVPASHRDELAALERRFAEACDRNAHERCRRFLSAEPLLSPSAARRHVEARAEDLAQTRPEYGHASNALCVVGRRSRTRGLFMDRRAFLVSYDPESDAEDETAANLASILGAVVPVCAGINLEYYFGTVDSTGWGCGTKLPHNITSLLGVMDGAGSDLRPGLPWQMVEIHEPLRLTMVVESTNDKLIRALERDGAVAQACHNGWITVAALDPDSSRIHLLENGAFRRHEPTRRELPRVESSMRWYQGLREHLGFASIGVGGAASSEASAGR